MADSNEELYRRHWNELMKFTYYVIGLNVACMAYAVHSTQDQTLELSHITWGLSILFWGLSIVCGLSYLSLCRENVYIEIAKREYNSLFQKDHNDIQAKQIYGNIQDREVTLKRRVNSLYKSYLILFYLGGISFLFWRILEMLPSCI